MTARQRLTQERVAASRRLMAAAREAGGEIPVPVDVVVANEFSASAEARIKPVDQVLDDEMILDVGPETAQQYAEIVRGAGTIVWNGPLGVFEFPAFAESAGLVEFWREVGWPQMCWPVDDGFACGVKPAG